MNKENLLVAIESLKEEEKKELLKFIVFPFLQLRPIDKALLKYFVNEGTEKRQDEIYIEGNNSKKHKHLKFKKRVCKEGLRKYPNAMQQWSRIMNRCYNALNEFIIYKSTRVGVLRNNILMNYYTERGISTKIYQALLRDLENNLKAEESRDYYHHYQMFKFYHYKAINEKNINDTSDILKKCSQHLDSFYIENKLRLYNEILTKKIDSLNTYEDDLIDFVIEASSESDDIAIKILRETYWFLFQDKKINATLWFSYIKSEKFNHFDQHMKKTILGYFLNFCAIQVNNKREEYIKLYLDAISFLEEKNILLDNNEISWRRYQTIIGFLMLEHNQNKARIFINKYSNKLNIKHRTSAKILAEADLNEDISTFYKLKNINGNIWRRIPYERLLIKYHLKNGNLKALNNQIKSFNLALWREKGNISETGLMKIKGLLKIVNKIMKNSEDIYEKKFILNLNELNNTELYGLDYIWLKRNYCSIK